jgi:3D (Asp-Asp-Asp) domain-containing protein
MFNRLALAGVLLLVFVLPNTANAGLLDWVSQDNEKSYIISTGSLTKVYESLKGFQPAKEEVKQDEKVEKVEVKPAIKVQSVKTAETKRTMVVMATAYSSTPDQTDDTPCITATGYNVCEKDRNIIAVSRDLVRSLGYGTQVRFPELFGNRVFHIEDTMNMRFTNRIDFHLDSREEAKTFGVKRNLKMEVI